VSATNTYITDCLDGVLAALDWTAAAAPGTVETVNLGGGERVRLDRLIALIAKALVRKRASSGIPISRGRTADGCRSRPCRTRTGLQAARWH